MNDKNISILITDKNGNCHDKTKEIRQFKFNETKNQYEIQFCNSSKIYTYAKQNVEILKHNDERSNEINQNPFFEYLKKVADFNSIKNEFDENLLVKTISKISDVNKKSVLEEYIHPTLKINKIKNDEILIFPFGANNSQFKAVENAMNNQISIIQGPPGTGKTQTILNIISNILIRKKTVLVVSNNNDATQNVLDKLSSTKYGLDFLCATLGKTENVKAFVEQQKQFYPAYLQDWQKIFFPELELEEKINSLKDFFNAQERISIINSELSNLQIEQKYFTESHTDIYQFKNENKFSADEILFFAQRLQYISSKKEKFSLFQKLVLKYKYRIFTKDKIVPSKVFETLKSFYYSKKIYELLNEKEEKERLLKTFETEKVYEQSFDVLKCEIALKYLGKKNRDYFSEEDIYKRIQAFTKEYPIVLSTTFSSRKVLGVSKDFLFDYLIMDESSQVDIVTGAIALSCAKNAVIVGDKKQLPNVIPENQKKEIQDIFIQTKLSEGYSYLNSFLDSVEKVLPSTPQTLLREHYRCHPKIIEFCNQQFYGGQLLIMTKNNNEHNVVTAIKTGEGNFEKNHFNQRQIDVIKDELKSNYSQTELLNLGIIAPYNNQVDMIKKQIPNIDVATVHKFQGREKDTIIISTVDDIITDFSDDSNMMNVAISRAKNKLVVVCSANSQPENSNLQSLIKYIQYNNFEIKQSKVNSIFDFLYTNMGNTKFNFLNKSKKISKFNSENAMNNLLQKITRMQSFSKFGFVFELPLKEYMNKNFLESLSAPLREYALNDWTHVDFTVFNKVTKEIILGIEVDGYTYHKSGTKQSKRDKLKDEIFELLEIPLLRCSTKGSGEENRIIEALNIKNNLYKIN